MKYIWSNKRVGTGKSITDPIRPLLFDIIKNTPKCVIWDKDLVEHIVILPDDIDPIDERNINNEINKGNCKWMTVDECISWIKDKINKEVSSEDIIKGIKKIYNPFLYVELLEQGYILVGDRLLENIHVKGFRFLCKLEKVV